MSQVAKVVREEMFSQDLFTFSGLFRDDCQKNSGTTLPEDPAVHDPPWMQY